MRYHLIKGLESRKFCKVLSIDKCADLSQNLSRSVRESSLSSDCTDFFVPFTHNYVFSISCNHLYNQIVVIEDSDELKTEIEAKSNNFKSLRGFSRFNKLAFEEIDDFLDHGEKIKRNMSKLTSICLFGIRTLGN